MDDEYPRLVRAVLAPLAEQHDLIYDLALLEPSPEPAWRAFAAVGIGADLLNGYRLPSDIPTDSKRTARKIAKAVTKSYRREAGQRAVVFLAHGLHRFLADSAERHEHPAEARFQSEICALLNEFYPPPPGTEEQLEAAFQAFRVFDGIAEPTTLATAGMHLSYMDQSRTDEEMLEAQQIGATDYYEFSIDLHGLSLAVRESSAELEAKLISPSSMSGEALRAQMLRQRWWADTARLWRERRFVPDEQA